jgi:hypothetical protein
MWIAFVDILEIPIRFLEVKVISSANLSYFNLLNVRDRFFFLKN